MNPYSGQRSLIRQTRSLFQLVLYAPDDAIFDDSGAILHVELFSTEEKLVVTSASAVIIYIHFPYPLMCFIASFRGVLHHLRWFTVSLAGYLGEFAPNGLVAD